MSDIQETLKSAIANGIVDPSRSAFLLCQASTHIDLLAARLAEMRERRDEWIKEACRLGGIAEEKQARLAEARLLLIRLSNEAGGSMGMEGVRQVIGNTNAACLELRVKEARDWLLATDSASAVQPERCCLDYPRCDCNSPPEPDNAPTLQPCGHPWEAQHDFKCILCSSPG